MVALADYADDGIATRDRAVREQNNGLSVWRHLYGTADHSLRRQLCFVHPLEPRADEAEPDPAARGAHRPRGGSQLME
jgi:hypothetical protein